jgi:hypothetical protein
MRRADTQTILGLIVEISDGNAGHAESPVQSLIAVSSMMRTALSIVDPACSATFAPLPTYLSLSTETFDKAGKDVLDVSTCGMRHPSPAACATRNNPAPTAAAPMVRATRAGGEEQRRDAEEGSL